MALTRAQLQDVCGLYSNDDTCIYLKHDRTEGCYVCLKKHKKSKETVDKIIAKGLKDGTIKDFNDNCPGYPLLKHIQQGYDIAPATP